MRQVAGTLKVDLAQFRDLEAFATFASDLDAVSKAQLERGYRLVELLKQPLNSPMPVELQVISVYAGTSGVLDDIPVDEVKRYIDVMAAYKLPKTTPEEQHTWSTTLQRSLERAADIPLEVARRAVYLMALAEETLTSGNPNAASDALSAATSLHAAALSALANVDINAITFIDKTRQQELSDSANSLRHRAQSLLRDVSEAFFIAVHS